MKFEKINIGELIKEKQIELGITNAKFAEMLNIQRQNVNALLSKTSIDTEKLASISEVLNYNFFQHFTPINANENYYKRNMEVEIRLKLTQEKKDEVLKILGLDDNLKIMKEK